RRFRAAPEQENPPRALSPSWPCGFIRNRVAARQRRAALRRKRHRWHQQSAVRPGQPAPVKVKGFNPRVHMWIAILAVLLLVAAHVALLGIIARAHLSVTLAAGLGGLVVVKYAWWRFRRGRSR